MKIRFAVVGLALAAACWLWLAGGGGPQPAIAAAAAASSPGACTFPTSVVGSPAETAWRIFVAANCPANKKQLVWETWTEQSLVYPASGKAPGGKAKRLHGSPLARVALLKKAGQNVELTPSTECNPMSSPPSNVVKGATVCEEVRLNPDAKKFVQDKKFQYEIRPGQTAAAKKGTDIQFPTTAVEVKVDWIPGTDFNPPFTCSKPPKGVHVESIDGVCYAMAGMHINSKLLPNWIWATFEPQSMLTNPNRCITFGPCNDPWGSVPPTSNGGASGFTQLTPALKALMTNAHLAPEFLNYRLDGVQTEFGTAQNPTLLGNSIIEGENVGLTAGQASCITCHSVSSIENNGTDGATKLADQVGPEYVPPPGWVARDFVWSMGLACPNAPFQTCTSSSSTGGGKKDAGKTKGP